MVYPRIRRQFCLIINSFYSLNGFLCSILHYCDVLRSLILYCTSFRVGRNSVCGLATFWTFRKWNCDGDEIFRTRPYWPWDQTTLL